MRAYRCLADQQAIRYVLIAQAPGDQSQHLGLTRRQPIYQASSLRILSEMLLDDVACP